MNCYSNNGLWMTDALFLLHFAFHLSMDFATILLWVQIMTIRYLVRSSSCLTSIVMMCQAPGLQGELQRHSGFYLSCLKICTTSRSLQKNPSILLSIHLQDGQHEITQTPIHKTLLLHILKWNSFYDGQLHCPQYMHHVSTACMMFQWQRWSQSTTMSESVMSLEEFK